MSLKMPNIAVKCSRRLFLFYYITLNMVKQTEKSYNIYTYISVLYFCIRRSFPMLYCCKDYKKIIRDKFFRAYFFVFQALQAPS